jgi:proteasome accessory factor B
MYRKGEIGSVARALRVLDALRGFKQGRRVAAIATEVGVSERTVHRDIAELQDAGFDIAVTKRERRVMATLAREQTYSPVSITKRERFTLLAVRNVFDVLRGTPFLDDIHAVMSKLDQRMSDKGREEHRASGERFIYLPDHGTKSYAGKEDIIDSLQTGVLSRKVVRFRYRGMRSGHDGFLAPFGLVLYRHGLYAIGARLSAANADTAGAKLGIFAVERFTECEHLRASTFTIPADFDMRKQLHGAFGPHLADDTGPHDVVVEFSREKAALAASREWHPTQTIEQAAGGRVRIAFRAPNLAPIVSWVLEWGPHARAVSPLLLVAEVVAELDGARAQYR